MRKLKLIVAALSCILVVGACADGDLTTTTNGDVTTTVANTTEPTDSQTDVAATVAELQADVTELANQIQNSEVAEEVGQSWNTLQTEVLAAFATMTDGGTVDTTAIQSAIDGFQDDLDALGDDVEPTLVDAWNTLKDRLESLMS